MDASLAWIAEHNCNAAQRTGDLRAPLKGADVFIGVSGARHPRTVSDIATMAFFLCFALANPQSIYSICRNHRGTPPWSHSGRSDYSNQIRNAVAFPGVFPRPARHPQSRRVEPA